MDKILILGGLGFIGKNFIKLAHDKYEIVVVNRSADDVFFKSFPNVKFYQYDFSNDKGIDIIFKNESPDFVINLISIVTADRDLNLFSSLIESNLNILLETFQALKDSKKLKLFLNFGSSEEYGNINSPFEEHNRERPNSPYALVKQLVTNTSIMLHDNYSFPIVVIRPSNLFGIYQPINKFIPYIVDTLVQGKVVKTSPGLQKRDFIFIDDFNKLLIKLIAKHADIKGQIINIGSGKSLSLKAIIEFCKNELNSKSIIEFGAIPYRENEIMDFKCDIKKLETILGAEINIDVLDSLKRFINSYKK